MHCEKQSPLANSLDDCRLFRLLSEFRPEHNASSTNEAGKYFVMLGGCNDCHTPGWDESGGTMATSDWLTGNPVGYRGPWGTSYPSNLRLFVQQMSEADWVQMFRTRNEHPPMPWVNYHRLAEQDLRNLHSFIKNLGAAGEAAPSYLPPDKEPTTPYILMVPQQPKQ
jgi:mono/diheme cytochrome c family protein